MNACSLLFVFLVATISVTAQQELNLRFVPLYKGNPVLTGMNDGISFQTFKFYISGIELKRDAEVVWSGGTRAYLLDIEDSTSLNIPLHIPRSLVYDALTFKFGVDSITQVSGQMDGVLDPLLGMYWTWQSGYINLKLEGSCNFCDKPGTEFQWHIGGYRAPYNTLQPITLPVQAGKELQVSIDPVLLLSMNDLNAHPHIMSPGAEAFKIARAFARCFSLYKP